MQATIHNEYLTLTVDTHGAEAVSLKNAAGEELLWQADPAVWERHAPILFPWTGKLKDGSFTHGGKTYKGGQSFSEFIDMLFPSALFEPCVKLLQVVLRQLVQRDVAD